MRLFIQIRDGQPHEHPILFDNFVQAFPDIDVNNLPPEFAVFERVPQPRECGPLQVEEVTYQWVDGIVKDVWTVREMIGAERETRIQQQVEYINAVWNGKKSDARQKIIEATEPEEKTMWQTYLTQLESVVISDPFAVPFPFKPVQLADGSWVTTDTAGTAPDVIG